MVERIRWSELPAPLLVAVEQRLGGPWTVTDAESASSCGVATLLTTDDGTAVFVKGQQGQNPARAPGRADDDSWWGPDWSPVDELGMEQAVNAYLPPSAPPVLWSLHEFGWHLLAFEGLRGRLAEYAPDSPDVALVAAALGELASWPAPDLDLPTAWDRWGYYCSPADRELLNGHRLMHTDPASTNVLICDDRARLVDWSWTALGPGWVDANLWANRLLQGGHTPGQAHESARRVPAFAQANPRNLAVFTRADARRWRDLADDRTPGAGHVAEAARTWADFVEHGLAEAR